MNDNMEENTALNVVNIRTNHIGANCPMLIPSAIITTTAQSRWEEKKDTILFKISFIEPFYYLAAVNDSLGITTTDGIIINTHIGG